MKLGVIGHPISHSKSPLIHQYWIKKYSLNGSYEAIDILPNDLSKEIQSLVNNGFDGFNVTVPHKEEVFNLCYDLTSTAKEIGAVNTVIIQNGQLIGDNTDAYGFTQNIKSAQFHFKNKKVLLLGAGGAARAIIHGFIQEDVSEIIISNRTIEKAEALIQKFPSKTSIVGWNDHSNALKTSDLLINATSLGMAGQAELNINLSHLKSDAIVTDIVYAPLMTPLLTNAQSQENGIVTGIGMLLHQAAKSFELWTGILPEITPELEKLVLK